MDKYRCKLFQIDNAKCSWQLMWDYARKSYVCYRCVMDALRDETTKKYEKSVHVPRPEITAEEKSAVDALFELMGTKEEDRGRILDILIEDRWHDKAVDMVEKLAKADWEKYVMENVRCNAETYS